MTIDIALIIALLSSVTINIFALWYIKDVLGRLTWISQNINDIVELSKAYSGHVRTIYSLQEYYGDEDIKNLLEHTTLFLEELEEYQEAVLQLEPVEFQQNNKEIENAENEEEDEVQKDVFYAGTRRRNS